MTSFKNVLNCIISGGVQPVTESPPISEEQAERAKNCIAKYGDFGSFLKNMNPDRQIEAARNKRASMFGDAPTLKTISIAYGKGAQNAWLAPQILSISKFFDEALNDEQITEICKLVANEYNYLKTTDFMLFAYFLKMGFYGKIYKLTPFTITLAIRQYVSSKRYELEAMEQEEKKRANDGKKVGKEAYFEYLSNKEKYQKK